ncbi:MAG TPA: DUF3488 and transglutaminase-like domain-containing protein [Ilumatobacteraceae bacterium]
MRTVPRTDAVELSNADPTPSTSRPVDTIPATLMLTVLSVITAIGFCRVFEGWDFLAPMLFVVIGAHAIALAMRLLRVPGYIAVPFSAIVVFCLIAWKYYPDTLSGPFPSSRTWDLLTSDLQLSRDQFPSAVAPVAAIGGFIVAATGAMAIAALLADAFAFRAFGRAEAAVPMAVMFVFASALGIDNHRVVITAAWLAAALGVIAALRAAHAQDDHAWIGQRARVLASVLPLAAVLAGCAALSGAVVGPRLPGAGEEGIVKTNRTDDSTEVLSPLVTIRDRLVNLSNTELFTVSANEYHYWREIGLPHFDGTEWNLGVGDNELSSISGSFAAAPAGSHSVSQDIQISDLGGNFLPVAYQPVSIDHSAAYWIPDTGTLVVPGDGIKRGDEYQVVSAVADLSPEVLRAATSDNPPETDLTSLPASFPQSVVETAQQVTAGATTTYDKALALQNWFRTNFTYDLSVQKGHSDNAILSFLESKRGYCEQFSGTFAAMARSLGIPTRVAVGFTWGDLGTDGKYHVYGRDAHAWPEVWFDNIGWVAFEPTPGRGDPGTQAYTNINPQEAAPGSDPNAVTSITDPAPVPVTTPGTGVTSTTAAPRAATTPTTAPPAAPPAKKSASHGAPTTLIVVGLLVVLAVAWILLGPTFVRRRRFRRRTGSPTAMIHDAWLLAARSLGLIALAPEIGETPNEHARRVEQASGIDHRVLRELAAHATAAIYGDIGDAATAERCRDLAGQVITAVKERLTAVDKMTAMFSPRRLNLLVTP